MGRIFGYVAERIIETQEEADAARYDTQSRGYRRSDRRQIAGRKDIGDYEWKDRPGSTRMDGRQIINAEDQFLLGYALPHSTGGIGNTFRYRNWTLNVYMDYALGHSVRNDMQMRYFQSTMGNCNYNLVNEVKNAGRSRATTRATPVSRPTIRTGATATTGARPTYSSRRPTTSACAMFRSRGRSRRRGCANCT